MGFTGSGIAAVSLVAKMMSAAATANGGGVAAGSLGQPDFPCHPTTSWARLGQLLGPGCGVEKRKPLPLLHKDPVLKQRGAPGLEMTLQGLRMSVPQMTSPLPPKILQRSIGNKEEMLCCPSSLIQLPASLKGSQNTDKLKTHRSFCNPSTISWTLPRPASSTSSEQPLYPLEPLEIFKGSGSTVSAIWVPVSFYAIEFTSAVLLASNLASKILSAGSLVKVGAAASGGVLAGLPWLSVPGRDWWELAWGLGRAQGPAQGPMGGDNSITFRLTLSSNASLAGATSTLGSLLGTLNGSYLLGCPAAALTTFPLGDNWPWVIDTHPWTPTQHMGPRLLQLWREELLCGDAVETQSWDPSRAQNVLLALCWALAVLPSTPDCGPGLESLPSSGFTPSPGSLKSPKLDVLCVCDVGACPSPPQPSSSPPTALAVGAVPVVLGAVGFTGAGITASSLAAKMMSAAAMANGGGVAASSPVATLQSVGKCPRWGLLWKVREDKSLRASSPDLSP
ncbi:hypothetical protein EI555_001002, partial [Monodon monoceros]